MGDSTGGCRTIQPAVMGRDARGKPYMLKWRFNDVSARPKYGTGREVLRAKLPEDLPVFFRKVGILVCGKKLSRAKGRSLLRQAVWAVVGEGTGMSYRLRADHLVLLKSGLVPAGVERWVVAEALKIRRRMQREEERQAEHHRRVFEQLKANESR